MKVLATLSVAATVAAVSVPDQQAFGAGVRDQQVLNGPAHQTSQHILDRLSEIFPNIQDVKGTFAGLTDDIKATWTEVTEAFPDALRNLVPPAKKPTRRPDSEWDHIVSGKAIQDAQTGSAGIAQSGSGSGRKIDGKLDAHTLRVKKVDPSALGVDKAVKQYSGYLDDNVDDKHLFYCKSNDLHTRALD